MSMSLQKTTTDLISVDMKTYKHFGERLKAYRDAKKVSNYKIQELTGYSRGNLSNIEAGKLEASDDVLYLLASVKELDVTYEQLVAWRHIDSSTEKELEALKKELEQLAH
jgi:transcriptional regulator with XRE-family HTH domain